MTSVDLLPFGNASERSADDIFCIGRTSHTASLTPPNPEVYGGCDKLGFCIYCISRGLTMAAQMGSENCKWYRECANDLLGDIHRMHKESA